MASGELITEVEIHPDIQEVEIETMPVDMPCETVETTIDCGDEPLISLQPLPEPDREIILQTQEEIVGSSDPLAIYDQIPVPTHNDIYIESSPGPSKRGARKARRGGLTPTGKYRGSDILGDIHETKARKWEQKQVQIKTLEGEFSVTMWASGADDGTFYCKNITCCNFDV